MRLVQLHHWLGQLLDAGVDKNIPVCIPAAGDVPVLLTEIDRAIIASGPYREDCSPEHAVFRHREGVVLVLLSGADSREQLAVSHGLSVPEPGSPDKN
ncbi:hypothetical protein [Enterobacter asburiae]|uniref:hypothetical protein n=1 Tax=Enterobacter asburiae TaxID=61645 RepID=UPI003F57A750